MIIIVCWLLVLHFSSCIDGLASLVWIFEIMQKSKNNFSNFERARQKLFTKKNMENKKCPKKCDTTSVKKRALKSVPIKVGWKEVVETGGKYQRCQIHLWCQLLAHYFIVPKVISILAYFLRVFLIIESQSC